MKEIINLHIGGTGITLGNRFWQNLSIEHGVNSLGCFTGLDIQEEGLGEFYSETETNRYTPRAIFASFDELGSYSTYPLAKAASDQHNGYIGWAMAYYTKGPELADRITEAIRREAEGCSNLQGIQLAYDLSTSSEGGLGSLMLHRLREEYPSLTLTASSILSNGDMAHDALIQPYHTVFSLSHLIANRNFTVLFDYSAMDKEINRNGYRPPPGDAWSHHNRIASDLISGVTAPSRFSGMGKADLDSLAEQMVLSPTLHFLTPSIAPFKEPTRIRRSLPEHVARELFQSCTWITDGGVSRQRARCLAYSANFRCKSVVENEMKLVLEATKRNLGAFGTEWMPENARLHLYTVPAASYDLSGTALSNFTAILSTLKAAMDRFEALHKRKLYHRPFNEEGMGDMEFMEAQAEVDDLIADYEAVENE